MWHKTSITVIYYLISFCQSFMFHIICGELLWWTVWSCSLNTAMYFFFLDIYKCHQCSAVRSAVSGLHQKGDTLHWCHGRHFRHPPGGETDKAGGEAERCKNEHTAWYHSQEKKILYTYLRWSSVIDKKMPVQWTHIWFWASWFIIQREQHIYKAVLSLSLL